MKKFFLSLYKSTHDLKFLRSRKYSRRNAWKYFAVFVLLFSFVYYLPAAFFIGKGVGQLNSSIQQLPDFEAKFQTGKLTIEKIKQPFFYKISDDFVIVADSTGINRDPVRNFVTSTSISYIFFGKDNLEYYDADTGTRNIQSWSRYPEATVTKSMLSDWTGKLMKFPYIILVLVFFYFVTYAAIFISKLYSILVVSLAVSVSARIRGMNWKWRELLAVCLYATTLPSIIELLLSLTPLRISYIHFIALFAFMLALIFTRDEAEKVMEE